MIDEVAVQLLSKVIAGSIILLIRYYEKKRTIKKLKSEFYESLEKKNKQK